METFAEQMQGVPLDDLEELFGESVTYLRGAQSIAITIRRNHRASQTQDESGVFVNRQAEEFLVRASELNFGAGAVAPARADAIRDAAGRVYEFSGDVEYLATTDCWRLPVVRRA